MLLLGACPLEKLFPGKVADGIARLTVANLGLMIIGIKQQTHLDPKCNLLSTQPLPDFQKTANNNERGQAHWEFKNCIFDFGNSTVILDDHQKIIGELSGKVTVSGQKRIYGYLTNHNEFPIIPEGEDSFHISFSNVLFDNFQAKIPEVSKNLTMVKGSLSFDTTIHLARSQSLHLCDHPLPNLTFKNIIYSADSGAIVRLPGFLGDFEIDIPTSHLDAQQNIHQDRANALQGHLTIWGNNLRQVPSDNLGLDPSFKASEFDKEIESIPDLDKPISYNCPFDRFLAIQASRLLIQNVGNIALELGQNKKCGPMRDSIWEQYLNTYKNSDSELKIPSQNCQLRHLAAHKLATDCHQIDTYVKGKASINANTFLTGKIAYAFHYLPFITGISRQDPQNLLIDFQKITLEDYVSYDIEPGEKSPQFLLRIKKGILSAQVEPIFTKKLDTQCEFSEPTPIAYFQNVNLKEAETTFVLNLKNIATPNDLFLRFDLDINASNLFAQNGVYNRKGNQLSGTITVDQKTHSLSDLALLPFFNQENFDQSYRCLVPRIIPPHQEWDPAEDCP